MMYRKLKRTWSHGFAHNIPNFRKSFPELSKVNDEELCDRFIDLNMEFYCEEKVPVSFWLRLSLPFAIVVAVLLFVGLPFNFLVTGKWGYSLGEKNYILNWFRALGLP